MSDELRESAPDTSWMTEEEIRDPGSFGLAVGMFLLVLITAAAAIYLIVS